MKVGDEARRDNFNGSRGIIAPTANKLLEVLKMMSNPEVFDLDSSGRKAYSGRILDHGVVAAFGGQGEFETAREIISAFPSVTCLWTLSEKESGKKEDRLKGIRWKKGTLEDFIELLRASTSSSSSSSSPSPSDSAAVDLSVVPVFDWSYLIDYKTRGFVGREWLTSPVEQWRVHGKTSKLLIEGEPGVGKTAWAAKYVSLSKGRGVLAGAHFCRYDETKTVDARQAVWSLGVQVVQWIEARSGKAVSSACKESVVAGDWEGLMRGLSKIQLDDDDDGDEDKIGVVVIDSFDEAEDRGAGGFFRLLGAEMPTWLKVVGTSRPRGRARPGLKVIRIASASDDNLEDMKEWLGGRHDQLLAVSGGNWLYASLVLSEGLEQTDELPLGLSGLYSERMKSHIEHSQDIMSVLEVIVAGVGWLPREVLLAAAGGLEARVDNALTALRNGVSVRNDDSAVRVYHKSFGDWAVETGLGGRVVDEVQGHVRLGVACANLIESGHAGEYCWRWAVFHAGFGADGGLKDRIWDTLAKRWSWISRKGQIDGWASTGDDLIRLGWDGRRFGKIIKQSMHLGEAGIALELALHGGEDIRAEVRGFVQALPFTGAFPWNEALEMRLAGHNDVINTVALVSDGRVVTGSEDGELKEWDVSSGECLQTLRLNEAVSTIDVCTQTRTLFAAAWGPHVRVVDLDSGEVKEVVKAHDDFVSGVVAVEGHQFVTTSYDGSVALWAFSQEERKCVEVARRREHDGDVMCVAAQRGSLIASGGDDGTIRLWSDQGLEAKGVLSGHSEGVTCLASSGNEFVSGSYDKTLRVWSEGRCLDVLSGHQDAVISVAVFERGNRVISGGVAGAIHLWSWDGELGTCIRKLRAHESSVNGLAPIDSQLVLSVGEDKQAIMWNTDSPQGWSDPDSEAVVVGRAPDGSDPHGVVWAVLLPDGRPVTGLRGGNLNVWVRPEDGQPPEIEAVLEGHTAMLSMISVVSGGRLASACGDNTVRVWKEIKRGSWVCTHALKGHENWVHVVETMPDGVTLASGGLDRAVRIWNADTGREERSVIGRGWVLALRAVGEDVVAAGGQSGELTLINVRTGDVLRKLEGHNGRITSLTFNFERNVLLSASDEPIDESLRSWSLDDPTCVGEVVRARGKLFPDFLFSDGTMIAHPFRGRVVEFWSWDERSLRHKIVPFEDVIATVLWDSAREVMIVVGRHLGWIAFDHVVRR